MLCALTFVHCLHINHPYKNVHNLLQNAFSRRLGNLSHIQYSRSITRVSSKQTNFFFGSNQNKPKLNLFRLIFGLFRETKNKFFRFVSVSFGISEPYRNNRNKQTCFETRWKIRKNSKSRGTFFLKLFFKKDKIKTESIKQKNIFFFV
jgi:hypothetical protein